MAYKTKIIDREVGRNAQLFAQAIAELETPAKRYPYLRILVSIVEQAHPDWDQLPDKAEQIARLVHEMSNEALDPDEVKDVVQVRDDERAASD